MSRALPDKPNLEHLKVQAKELLHAIKDGVPEAEERLRTLAAIPAHTIPKLAHAQRAIAKEYGFASWPKLKAHVESLTRVADPVAALVDAIKADDVDRVDELLQHYPQLRARLNDPLPGLSFGATPLLAVLSRRNKGMVDRLLAAGADINQKSHWWAGGFGVLDDDHGLAAYLIERGAVVDVHAAARLGMVDRLATLIAANPELVHARGGDGQTPLHAAPDVDIARYLLDHGADIDALDVDHESTPAQYMARERQDVARYLVSRGCRTDILMAAALGDVALVRAHLDADPAAIYTSVSEKYFPKRDPRAGGSIYIWVLGVHKTAHALAREFGHEDVLALLRERSDATLQLALACELGDEALVERLMKERSEPLSPLSPELQRKLPDAADRRDARAVRLLLLAGWPVNARGDLGGTALHFAAWHGRVSMVHEILKYQPLLEVTDTAHGGTPLGWALHGSMHCWHKEDGDYVGVVEVLLAAGATAPALSDDVHASVPVREVLLRRAEQR